jgi:DnaJ-class molecular chaperone
MTTASPQPYDCLTCNGSGRETVMQPIKRGQKLEMPPCPVCGGTGKKPPPKPA